MRSGPSSGGALPQGSGRRRFAQRPPGENDYGVGADYGSGRRSPRTDQPNQSFRGRGPKGYQRSDERIHEDVCDRLSDDSWIDASDIEVRVDNGEVTLSGRVDERAAKFAAESLCDSVSGVRDIQNQLRCGPRDQEQSESETKRVKQSAGRKN